MARLVVIGAGFSNPPFNPQNMMSCMTYAALGSPRVFASCCKTNSRSAVTATGFNCQASSGTDAMRADQDQEYFSGALRSQIISVYFGKPYLRITTELRVTRPQWIVKRRVNLSVRTR
jgi:hypothetical protein